MKTHATPAEREEARRAIATAQAVGRAYRHVAAADETPTIPVPPPDPRRLKPARRPHQGYPAGPWDDRPTAPPPADVPSYPRDEAAEEEARLERLDERADHWAHDAYDRAGDR